MHSAYLVRVGIDSTPYSGRWNAPVDVRTGEWVYVPLLQSWDYHRARPEMRRGYDELVPALSTFAKGRADPFGHAVLPHRLAAEEMHLDPDFTRLTYGDSSTPRGTRIGRFGPGDRMIFIAGLQPLHEERPLHYAIIGRFVVDEVVLARDVPAERSHENAHTRPTHVLPADVVIRARRGVSGRLRRCIGIGELRGKYPRYRVLRSLLEEWGGLCSKDGYIQKGSPFKLENPERFEAWWDHQNPELVASNW